ncbi:hypothetical protein [Denitromonas iodatirespirans]|uniref:Carbohydrate porin n=1 Tax=Denitromonas iodatirespirans TaxID=2795389 RepID=A0A944DBD1_DENI1|nr:hypothetical protein [Denitromonas iodatirespirans]MBT0961911.1 hypothetical protein [Denitromonas iodatirespirans]
MMTVPSKYRRTKSVLAVSLALAFPAGAMAQSATELNARINELEQELARTRAQLEASKAGEAGAKKELEAAKANSAPAGIAFDNFLGGKLKVGGAIRANYAVGDYGDYQGKPTRAERDGGNFTLDTYRINLDYANDNGVIGKLEYRFYNGYHFLHTGWLGYNFDDGGQIQVGVNRVPFGPGAYGVSQSWFFDQHYYVGLADDMDLGVKYTKSLGNLTIDAAYYLSDEGTGHGGSVDSARYSYDVVNESRNGYEEENQVNLRAIYHFKDWAVKTDLGASLMYGKLNSQGPQDDGDRWAASAHMVNKWNNFTLATQLTRYSFNVDKNQPLGTDKVVRFGAFDFTTDVAAKAWIPAVSLSYYKETPSIPWLDYVIPYIEYSSIVKDEDSFKNSDLMTLGAAWGHGGWYIYTEWARSNGNDFVGNETSFADRLAANSKRDWQNRFNINLGYYF